MQTQDSGVTVLDKRLFSADTECVHAESDEKLFILHIFVYFTSCEVVLFCF